ncbi:MAG: hypothetical protein MJD61_11025 [Proteobacteria bacterium]|nr:hypothetical protein [Pseudomonadota bacterium]
MSDATPDGAVSLFLAAMDRSRHDREAVRAAYALLSEPARRALARRARRAVTLAGRSFEPWEMIAAGRFRLRFTPSETASLKVRQRQGRTLVVVQSEDSSHLVEVPVVQEGGRWRLALTLPDPPGGFEREVSGEGPSL